ncbi:hypothetical protein [Methylobacterium sp. WL120]|uniref:terminase small subunit-like protein n=1 Tax=Methylobacterium sp. WL120 TaxID=2603887 RepID=UPI0011CB078C|nr:hypothetical protein [Methylobacterium sp. WL120]TXM64605.1 hypothetical protein FV229_18100 [Methylobacterium sp. WL120]
MTAYSATTAALIVERIADGESLRRICQGESMPSRETVRRWVRDNAEFRQSYTEAMQVRPDAFLEQIIDISNDETKDWQHRRLQISTLQWAMAKCAPKKYGEKITHAGDADAPLITAEAVDVGRRLAFLLTKSAIEQQEVADRGRLNEQLCS